MTPMHKPSRRLGLGLVSAVALALLGGCAGNASQQVALNTLKATTEYEKQLTAKIAAESAFYETRGRILSDSLAGPSVDLEKGIEEVDVKQTWLYGHIRTLNERDALDTAGRMLSVPPGRIPSMVRDYTLRSIEVSREGISRVRAERLALAEKSASALQPVEIQKRRLAALRKGLAELSADRARAADTARFVAFAKTVVGELRKQTEASGD